MAAPVLRWSASTGSVTAAKLLKITGTRCTVPQVSSVRSNLVGRWTIRCTKPASDGV